jgi:hypothetical protein
MHVAYWKYLVRRRLLGERRGSFPIKGSNWFVRPTDETEEAWRNDRALLDDVHQTLRAAVAESLRGKARNLPTTMIFGSAFHDIYHAGQVRLLRRLQAGLKSDKE